MKIAFVTELFLPSIGGQEVRFDELGAELTKRGIEVELYTIRHDPASPKEEIRSGMAVHRITDCFTYKSAKFRRNPVGIVRFTADLWKIRDHLKSFDAVVFNIWPILPALVIGPKLGQKTVVDICETRSGAAWRWIYGRLAAIPNARIVGVNPEIVRHMIREHGVKPQDASALVSGVDLEAAGQVPESKNPKQIMFFGRLTEHKNPRMLAEAFGASKLPDAGYTLVIAGGGPELDGLKRDFPQRSIRCTGRVSEEEKWSLLRESSLLVLPSKREGFPRVVAEAACVGTPTLTLDYPDNGTRHVVADYGVGRSVPASMADLVSALDSFHADRQGFLATAERGLLQARSEFGWTEVTNKFLTFLRSKESKSHA